MNVGKIIMNCLIHDYVIYDIPHLSELDLNERTEY